MADLNSRIKCLFPNRVIIAFCFSNRDVMPTMWMEALATKLRDRGYAVIGLLTSITAHHGSLAGIEPTFIVKGSEIKTLDNVNIFISTDLEWLVQWPEKSLALAIMHGSNPLATSVSLLRSAHYMGAFDGYVLGFSIEKQKASIRDVWTGYAPPRWNMRHRDNFYIMEYGFLKLCALRQIIKGRQQNRIKAIAFVQHESQAFPEYGLDRTRKIALPVLRRLLAEFPGYDIIYRPNPNDLASQEVKEIQSIFAADARFRLDDNREYTSTMTLSRCMVSDFSSLPMTYSILTGNPAVYFQPWEFHEPTQNSLNFYACTLDQMIDSIKLALSMSNKEKDALRNQFMAEKGYLPFDHSLDELADDIALFIADKPREQWLTIPRQKGGRGMPIQKIAAKLFESPKGLQAAHANFLSQYRSNRFLAWLAIFLYHKTHPLLPVDKDLWALLHNYKNIPPLPKNYSCISIPGKIRTALEKIYSANISGTKIQ